MKYVVWKAEKNEELRTEGRPCFEDVFEALRKGGFRDILENPTHDDRKILVVMIENYAHAVPFKIFEKFAWWFTVFPSRKLQAFYGDGYEKEN